MKTKSTLLLFLLLIVGGFNILMQGQTWCYGIEAEQYTSKSGTGWVLKTTEPGYSGTGKLSFDVMFPDTGTYYLYLRSYAIDHLANGVHLELDGSSLSTIQNRDGVYVTKASAWAWASQYKYNIGGVESHFGPVYFKVNSAGKHTLTFPNREKNFSFDRLIVTNKKVTPPGDYSYSGDSRALELNIIDGYPNGISDVSGGFPVVTIVQPTQSKVIGIDEVITIEANASDPDGTIKYMKFYDGAILISTDSIQPYSCIYSTSIKELHTIKVMAIDNEGKGTAQSVNIFVASSTSAINGYIDNFDDGILSADFKPENNLFYKLSEANGIMKMDVTKTDINKGYSAVVWYPTDSFFINMIENPYISIKVKASNSIMFQLGPVNTGQVGNKMPIPSNLPTGLKNYSC